jgi:hypothetical protein
VCRRVLLCLSGIFENAAGMQREVHGRTEGNLVVVLDVPEFSTRQRGGLAGCALMYVPSAALTALYLSWVGRHKPACWVGAGASNTTHNI